MRHLGGTSPGSVLGSLTHLARDLEACLAPMADATVNLRTYSPEEVALSKVLVEHVYYHFWQWCMEDSESESSYYYRKLKILVDSLRHFVKDCNLRGVDIFLFTDSSVVKAAF
jgi:hypothetical protein